MAQQSSTSVWSGRADRFAQQDAGQTIIELALALPVLFLMIFGFINFALVMHQLSNITYGAHAAARYAGVHSDATIAPATTASVTSFMSPFLSSYPANVSTVTVTYPGTGTNTVGGTVQVVVTLTYTLHIPFTASKNINIQSTGWAAITV